MYAWMDAWMDGWLDGWLAGRLSRCMDGWMGGMDEWFQSRCRWLSNSSGCEALIFRGVATPAERYLPTGSSVETTRYQSALQRLGITTLSEAVGVLAMKGTTVEARIAGEPRNELWADHAFLRTVVQQSALADGEASPSLAEQAPKAAPTPPPPVAKAPPASPPPPVTKDPSTDPFAAASNAAAAETPSVAALTHTDSRHRCRTPWRDGFHAAEAEPESAREAMRRAILGGPDFGFDYDANCDFPLENLPFGVFSCASRGPRCATAIGDRAVDLAVLADHGAFDGSLHRKLSLHFNARHVFHQPTLNSFMALPRQAWRSTRQRALAWACRSLHN
eukprot:s114_g4.t1